MKKMPLNEASTNDVSDTNDQPSIQNEISSNELSDGNPENESGKSSELTRRRFITIVGGIGIAAVLGGTGILEFAKNEQADIAFPVSGGYLVVDSMRCCGCQNCMMACAMTHYGVTNPGLSRIQIVGDSFQRFPYDMTIYQCQQCSEPKCVEVCPTGACFVDSSHDNVRTITPDLCIGCLQCIDACPNNPSRLQWNYMEQHSQKCDLCYNTPYWDHETGPDGIRACESICPERAIKFVTELPKDTGNTQYDIDMHTGTTWPEMMIFAEGSTGQPGSEGSSVKQKGIRKWHMVMQVRF